MLFKKERGFKVKELQEIQNLYKEVLGKVRDKIFMSKLCEEYFNLKEERKVLIETIPLIKLVFKTIRDNFPGKINNLLVEHPIISISIFQQLESILNEIGFCLSSTSVTSFTVTAIDD